MKIKLTPEHDSANTYPEEVEFELNKDEISFDVDVYGEEYKRTNRRLVFKLAHFEILLEAAKRNSQL